MIAEERESEQNLLTFAFVLVKYSPLISPCVFSGSRREERESERS